MVSSHRNHKKLRKTQALPPAFIVLEKIQFFFEYFFLNLRKPIVSQKLVHFVHQCHISTVVPKECTKFLMHTLGI